MKDLAFNCWVKSQIAKQNVKNKFEELYESFKAENGGADSIIIAIIIIVIVVAIGIIFKDAIFGWVGTLIGNTDPVIEDTDWTAPSTP